MYDEKEFKLKIMSIVEQKQLYSVMNNTKWRELRNAINKLPFPPAYQIKDIHSDKPAPVEFDSDVWYKGNWDNEVLMPYFQIEWICIRPRCVRYVGKFVKLEILDETQDLLSILQMYSIPYEEDGRGGIIIYGYPN